MAKNILYPAAGDVLYYINIYCGMMDMFHMVSEEDTANGIYDQTVQCFDFPVFGG